MGASRVRSPNPGLPQVLFLGARDWWGSPVLSWRGALRGGAWPGSDTWSAVPMEGVGDGVKAGSPILRGWGRPGGHEGDAPELRPR